MTIHNPYSSTKSTNWVCDGQSADTMMGYPLSTATGTYTAMDQITGIKIYPSFSSYGFDSSTKFTVYGYRK